MLGNLSCTTFSDGSKGYSMTTEMAITINTVVGQQSTWLQFQKDSHNGKMKSQFPMVDSLVLAYYNHTTLFRDDTMNLGTILR